MNMDAKALSRFWQRKFNKKEKCQDENIQIVHYLQTSPTGASLLELSFFFNLLIFYQVLMSAIYISR